MLVFKASTAGQPRRLPGRFIIIALALSALGATCEGNPIPAVTPPVISLTVNGMPDDMKNLMVLPPTGFVVNVAWQPGSYPIDPASTWMFAKRWGALPGIQPGNYAEFELPLKSDGSGAVGVFTGQLAPGTYTLAAYLSDTAGNFFNVQLAFAVRNFGGPIPIGAGQQIWLDFESDRDATPGADFPVDLETFGLASPAAPLVSSWVLNDVKNAVLARVEEVYYDHPANGLPGADPVEVAFSLTDPGSGDVTRVCIGGQAAGGSIGSILTDPNNSNRNSIECGTLPATGIFPRGLVALAGEADFQNVFYPVMATAGGVPVGEHPLDATVLTPGFDPAMASPAELARYDQVGAAIQGFADMLGSIVAHETGHALGLVPAGVPGGGLYGGTGGPELNHAVTPADVSPTENFLMNAGNTFTFARLAGLNGNLLPSFRPIDYAYLRDRVVVDSAVTVLALPPVLSSVTPNSIAGGSYTQIFFNGSGFLPTPVIRCIGSSFTYNVTGESLLSSSQVKGWVNYSQIPAGIYDVELRNPDGQIRVLPGGITITAP